MIKEGDKAPDFTLQNAEDQPVSLADFKGKTVILYFYPRDNTPGCTKEACGFGELNDEITDLNAAVIGISGDSVKSHQNFKTKYGLPFQLLSDPEKSVIQAFGAWGLKKSYGKEYMGLIRSTFVIGPDGIIQKVFPKVKAAQHPAEILELLKTGK